MVSFTKLSSSWSWSLSWNCSEHIQKLDITLSISFKAVRDYKFSFHITKDYVVKMPYRPCCLDPQNKNIANSEHFTETLFHNGVSAAS